MHYSDDIGGRRRALFVQFFTSEDPFRMSYVLRRRLGWLTGFFLLVLGCLVLLLL